MKVLATVSHPDELLPLLPRLRPDVVLLDTTLPNAVAAVREIGARVKDVRVVAITAAETEEDVLQLAEAGVAGYVLPDGSLEDLIVALESAARGEFHVSPRVAYRLLRRLGSLAAVVRDKTEGPSAELTPRELEIIELIDRGMSNKDVARHLGIEVGTVKNHVHNILKKLHVHRRINASAWYRKAGFHLRLEA